MTSAAERRANVVEGDSAGLEDDLCRCACETFWPQSTASRRARPARRPSAPPAFPATGKFPVTRPSTGIVEVEVLRAAARADIRRAEAARSNFGLPGAPRGSARIPSSAMRRVALVDAQGPEEERPLLASPRCRERCRRARSAVAGVLGGDLHRRVRAGPAAGQVARDLAAAAEAEAARASRRSRP